jgi:SET domain-containing protein
MALGECWLHPFVGVAASMIEGRGLFANAPIEPGEPVSRLDGTLVDDEHLTALFEEQARDASSPYIDTIAFDDGRHLVLPVGTPQHFGNHSCDPNLWWDDAVTLVARSRIESGEELTNDYGTSSVGSFRMACRCGSPLCRHLITGEDWRRADLRDRYGRHFVPALLKRIDSLSH